MFSYRYIGIAQSIIFALISIRSLFSVSIQSFYRKCACLHIGTTADPIAVSCLRRIIDRNWAPSDHIHPSPSVRFANNIWTREHRDEEFPASFGEQSVKAGAVQDAARAVADGRLRGSHELTACIYMAQQTKNMCQLRHALKLPIHELLPNGKALHPLDLLAEMKRVTSSVM